MNTLETDVEVSADGSLKLLSPLPEWLKPGPAHVLLSVPNGASTKPKRVIPTATPEILAKRATAFDAIRAMGGLKDDLSELETRPCSGWLGHFFVVADFRKSLRRSSRPASPPRS